MLCVGTFVTHYWVLTLPRGEKDVLYHVGETSTVVVRGDGQDADVGPGLWPLVNMYSQLPPLRPEWGRFRKRGTVMGISICAYDVVQDIAMEVTRETVQHMLSDVDASIIQRMKDVGLEIAIIGRDQCTSDIPAHAHLKNKYTEDGRLYDTGTRGLGATVACPVLSVGEENVLMQDDAKYPRESILVHEFAHAVMNIGLWGTTIHARIEEAFRDAKEKHVYREDSYVAFNAQEYWAEMTQAWFHATARRDSTSGVTDRRKLCRIDSALASIMTRVWGDGAWRYPATSPRPFPRKTPVGLFSNLRCWCGSSQHI